VRSTAPEAAPVTTLAQEKRVNAFFRLSNPRLIARLRERFPQLPERPDPQAVFLKLRELRDSW
jgi:hydroxyacylglutathione hydrolase